MGSLHIYRKGDSLEIGRKCTGKKITYVAHIAVINEHNR